MERIPVESSHISSIGHDPNANLLEVEFHSGHVYHYHNVSAQKHEQLMNADSIGTHFSENIKRLHTFRRVR